MSPFLPALFTVALSELGNTNAQLSRALTEKRVTVYIVLPALAAVSAVVLGASAVGGYFVANSEVAQRIRAAELFLGMALMWAAHGQFRKPKPLRAVEGVAPVVIALRGYTRIALAGSAGWLAMAIGMRSGGGPEDMAFAALGGVLGVLVANTPPLFLERRQLRALRIHILRTISGCILAIVGFAYALIALRLL